MIAEHAQKLLGGSQDLWCADVEIGLLGVPALDAPHPWGKYFSAEVTK